MLIPTSGPSTPNSRLLSLALAVRLLPVTFLVAGCIVGVQSAHAQAVYGSIVGTAVDQSAAPSRARR